MFCARMTPAHALFTRCCLCTTCRGVTTLKPLEIDIRSKMMKKLNVLKHEWAYVMAGLQLRHARHAVAKAQPSAVHGDSDASEHHKHVISAFFTQVELLIGVANLRAFAHARCFFREEGAGEVRCAASSDCYCHGCLLQQVMVAPTAHLFVNKRPIVRVICQTAIPFTPADCRRTHCKIQLIFVVLLDGLWL